MIAMVLADMFAEIGRKVSAIEATDAGAVAAAVLWPDHDRRCAISDESASPQRSNSARGSFLKFSPAQRSRDPEVLS
jgi:hypothetical protein